MPTPVVACGRQKDVLFSHFGAEEGIRNLNQNTGAVAAQRISTDRARDDQDFLEFAAPASRFRDWPVL